MLFARRKAPSDGAQGKKPAREGREIAGIASDLYEPLAGWLGIRPNRDPLLTTKQPGSAYDWPWGLLEEALDKDAHLSSLVTQRKAAVLGWRRRVVPADDSALAGQAAVLAALLLEEGPGCLEGPGGIDDALSALLDAVPYGIAVAEVIWQRRRVCSAGLNGDYLLPLAIRSRHPRRFVFDNAGQLRLLTREEPIRGLALPPRRFIVFAPYGRHENPYGLPQLRSVWWLSWFKRQVLRFWVMFCEKFGSPTTVATHPAGAALEEKQALRRIVGSLQQETGIVLPDGVELSLLEGSRSGSVETYLELIEFCNREMSKALLGQTLTTQSDGKGSYALGQVHENVRADIIRSDARALAALLNATLIPWLIELNLPQARHCLPRLELSPPLDRDLRLELEIDGFLAAQGLRADPAELAARYGRSLSSITAPGGAHADNGNTDQ
jgi:phage gp29-like protein